MEDIESTELGSCSVNVGIMDRTCCQVSIIQQQQYIPGNNIALQHIILSKSDILLKNFYSFNEIVDVSHIQRDIIPVLYGRDADHGEIKILTTPAQPSPASLTLPSSISSHSLRFNGRLYLRASAASQFYTDINPLNTVYNPTSNCSGFLLRDRD